MFLLCPGFDEYLLRVQSEGRAVGVATVVASDGSHRVWQYHSSIRRDGTSEPGPEPDQDRKVQPPMPPSGVAVIRICCPASRHPLGGLTEPPLLVIVER